uniref:Chromo domain-containing protein n=1 Tax=Vitrella brassicaformis TaxID=1169539 RepID=A0A7S1K671_9ALVE
MGEGEVFTCPQAQHGTEYEVDVLLAIKLRPGKVCFDESGVPDLSAFLYLIRWKHWPPDHDEWERHTSLAGSVLKREAARLRREWVEKHGEAFKELLRARGIDIAVDDGSGSGSGGQAASAAT